MLHVWQKKNDAARCSRGEEREGRAARWGGHGRTLTAPTSRVRSGCNSRISRRQRGVATERGRTAGHRCGGDLAPSFFFFFFSVLWFYLSQCLLLLLRLLLLIFLQIISYGVMNFCYFIFFLFLPSNAKRVLIVFEWILQHWDSKDYRQTKQIISQWILSASKKMGMSWDIPTCSQTNQQTFKVTLPFYPYWAVSSNLLPLHWFEHFASYLFFSHSKNWWIEIVFTNWVFFFF